MMQLMIMIHEKANLFKSTSLSPIFHYDVQILLQGCTFARSKIPCASPEQRRFDGHSCAPSRLAPWALGAPSDNRCVAPSDDSSLWK
jgi:hypothetical protein